MAYEPGAIDKELVAKAMGVFPENEPDVYAFLSKALDSPLPEPWTEHADKKGRVFYWNPASRHSSWSHPLTSTHKSLVHAYRRIKAKEPGEERSQAVLAELDTFHKQGEEELEQWRVSHAPDGTPYYYKTGTQQTRWDNPRDELLSHQELRICMLSELLEDRSVPESRPYSIQEGHAAIEDGESQAAITSGSSGAAVRPDGSMEVTMMPSPSQPEAPSTLQGSFLDGNHPRALAGLASDGFGSTADEKAVTSQSHGAILDADASLGRSGLRPLGASGSLGRSGDPLQATWGSTDLTDKPKVTVVPPTLEGMSEIGSPGARSPRSAQRSRSPGYPDEATLRAPVSPIASLLTPVGVKAKSPRDLSRLLDQNVEVGWVQPDEIGLHLGLNYIDPTDMACYSILKPIFLSGLPAPWQAENLNHGRVDFFHPGAGELRQSHPLFSFFNELLQFLREQAVTDVPLSEPMSASIFCEASPQCVRNRLGVWEGPLQDPTTTRGKPLYQRILPGTDGACVKPDTRSDDPRAEAAANIIARLDAWHHLWQGFTPEDLFPLRTDRIAALATQLSESVVVAPGNRADKEWVLHQWNWQLEIKAPVHRMKRPFTREELELQPEVTGLLGLAYGKALTTVAAEEAPYAKDKQIAWELCRLNYRVASTRIEEEDDPYEDASDEFEEEVEEEAELSEEEYSDDEIDEPPEDEAEKLPAPEEDVDSLSASGSSTGRRRMKRKKHSGLLGDIGEDSYEDEEDSDADSDSHYAPSDALLEVATPPETPRPEVIDFLGLKGTDQAGWAETMLRPLTPPESPRAEVPPFSARSLPQSFAERQKKGFDEDIWGGAKFLKVSVIAPYVADLGWRCHLEIMHGMYTESDEAAKAALEETTSPLSATAGRTFARDSSPMRDKVSAPLDKSVEQASRAVYPPSSMDDLPSPKSLGATSPKHKPMVTPPTSPAKTFRGQLLPPVALEQMRERSAQEIDTFREMLRSSNQMFDDYMSGRGAGSRPTTPIVQLELDAEVFKDRVTTRADLTRPYLPVREKLKTDDMSVFNTAIKGAVPPVPSPNLARGSALPVPQYLIPLVTDAPRATGSRSRPSSAGPKKTTIRLRDQLERALSAEARARRPKVDGDLLPEKKNVLAEMATEGVRQFLSRKCGRMESVMNAFDTKKLGYITREDWRAGLEKLGYDKMEYADQIFTSLDKRRHHVLTLSDLQKRSGSNIDEGMPEQEPITAVFGALLGEAMHDEMQTIVHEALNEVLAGALRDPQRPLSAGLPDVNGWLKARRNRAKKLAKEEAARRKAEEKVEGEEGEEEEEEEEESDSDPEAELLRELTGEKKPDSASSKKKKKTGKKKLQAVGKMLAGRRRGNKTGTAGSGDDTSGRSGRSRSPGQKKKKITVRSVGMLGKLLARSKDGTASSGSPGPGNRSRQGSPGKAGSSRSPGAGKRTGGSPGKRQGVAGNSTRTGVSGTRKKDGKLRPGEMRVPGRLSNSPGRSPGPSPPGTSGSVRPGQRRQGSPGQGKIGQRTGKSSVPGRSGAVGMRRPKREDGDAEENFIGDRASSSQAGTPDRMRRGKAQAHLASPSEWATKIGAMNSDRLDNAGGRASSLPAQKGWHPHSRHPVRHPNQHPDEDDPLASYDIGFHEHSQEFDSRKAGLLPWAPRRPEDVCKTYGHIFKLLNDPHLKKRMPKQKQSVHVSLPRLPAAGLSIAGAEPGDNLDHVGKLGGNGARSAPDLAPAGITGISTTAGSTWRAGSAASLDTQGRQSNYVTLPPLAKSAPERRMDPLSGGLRQGIYAG